MPKIEPMRNVIGEALFDEYIGKNAVSPPWSNLPDERREPWRKDADRVIDALATGFGWHFQEYAYEFSGADWLAMSPDELWREFFEHIQKTKGPHPIGAAS